VIEEILSALADGLNLAVAMRVLGQVIEGMDVIRSIARGDVIEGLDSATMRGKN
jgi:hypothetical protein